MPTPALLLASSALVCLLMVGVLWSLARNNVPGVKACALSALLFCGSALLLAVQPHLPWLLGVIVANTMLSTAMALYVVAMRQFFDRSVPVVALAAVIVVQIVGLLLFWCVWRDVALRIVLVSGVLSGLACAAAATVVRYRPLHRPAYPYVLAVAMLLLLALIHALRATAYLLHLDPIESVAQASMLQTVVLSIGLLARPGLILAMILMAYDRMLSERESEANTDALTGVLSRKAWWLLAGKTVAGAARNGRRLSLLVLDIDRFAHINETYGPQLGDAVLRHFAILATDVLREEDLIGRVDGEKFAVLFPDTPIDAARLASEKLLRAVRGEACSHGSWSIGYTFSAGLVQWDGQERAQALVERAHRALAEAKNGGRDRIIAQQEVEPGKNRR
ncbi:MULTISPECIES: GGDEF domain-containing protein [unclassified Achromobacter]|uniref:GGDEF domain-containing protein n=1 Tax=unclassified Achromobacter TaxID=2626865 RepID=UPI000B516FFD|nr:MULTISPECIES: GGDEF domain-containing protein [unclassified Achromobacter]OWT80019.1 GGDEF domain-containing protein [Achromobacter sp. HZ34]OWT81903.1 GGDEF domain-containing protein [Achromobacter sp. HZ28]